MVRFFQVIAGKVSPGFIFFKEFIRYPRQLASVIPSSSFLKRRIVKVAGLDSAQLIVELGIGTGCVTQAILQNMPADAKLLAIELNETLFEYNKQTINDPRCHIYHGNACELKSILAELELGKPDIVISGIPFSCIPSDLCQVLVDDVYTVLQSGGRFVAYQISSIVKEYSQAFGDDVYVEMEWLNVPPLRVWRWVKV